MASPRPKQRAVFQDASEIGDAFAVWPPPRVSEVDPNTFGVATWLGGPRTLNPYVPRSIDAGLDEALKDNRAVVVSTPRGAGASRTIHGYRRDCSGYASMALGLPGPGMNSAGLAARATPIAKTELQPGGLLINPAPDLAGHVVIFVLPLGAGGAGGWRR
jgi:hypothetical protein